MVKAKDGAGSAGFVGSDAAECNDVLGPCFLHCSGDRVAYPIRISKRVGAGGIGWNHDVGGVGLLKGLGESAGVGEIGDESLRTFRCESL